MASGFVTGLFANAKQVDLDYAGELGSVPWVFSHLKLTMHVHLFHLRNDSEIPLAKEERPRRWASADAVESETMGSGQRLCWRLVATQTAS